jgi:hypothetical protein
VLPAGKVGINFGDGTFKSLGDIFPSVKLITSDIAMSSS